jgi:FKBP-type peptidyl-prolyl cis-trans isomerase SlyD
VAELVDAHDSKSCILGCAGSIPAFGTKVFHLSPEVSILFFDTSFKTSIMQITKHTVAAIHYTLTDNEGNVLDSSAGRDPLHYIHGIGNLIPGMEEGLEGKTKGEKFNIKVSPEKGYGVKSDELLQQVPRSAFGDQPVEVGMQFQTNQGSVVTVTKIGLDAITVDANHPLAGVELNFDVEVLEIRLATEEELAHGHVHGPGGHHH